MKKNIFLLFGILCLSVNAQTTINIPLSQGNGQDAYLASGAATSNYGNHQSMGGNTWTCGGSLCLSRALFQFDMSTVPAGATVTGASLRLYADLNWSQSATTGPGNDGFLSRVTAPWGEFTATWANQPAVTTLHQLSVPASTSSAQNYTLNVTSLVQDMLATNNYGFLLQMQDEVNYFKSLMFASSDNTVTARCPVLELTINSVHTGINETKAAASVKIFPNPSTGIVHVELPGLSTESEFIIYDVLGKAVFKAPVLSASADFNIGTLDNGTYYYALRQNEQPLKEGKIIVIK